MARRSRRRPESPKPETTSAAAHSPQAPTLPWGSREWAIVAILLCLNLLVFGQLVSHSFINYDDGQFITENVMVKQGLTAASITWALTSASIGWYPLTWLSHMLDVELYELRPSGHLMTGLLLHSATTSLLFIALRSLSLATWPSAIVAALFAIHPMHVESVAWASERKDTLSTFFIALALLLYSRYARRPSGMAMAAVALAYAASLLSKQMYVTLPFVLLLLDYWPLDRLSRRFTVRELAPLVVEKVPLFALTVIGVLAAVIGQRNLAAVQSTEILPFTTRLANAVVAYARYLGNLFWPNELAVLYPLVPIPAVAVIGATALLTALTFAAWRTRESAPYFIVGWLWFLGTLVPVIGIVQIGSQAIADRYTYFSYTGLFIALVWGLNDLSRRIAISRRAMTSLAVAVLALLGAVAWKQTGYWIDSATLFARVVSVTPPNAVAEYNLGQALQMADPDAAIPHLQRSLQLADESLRRFPTATRPDWYAQSHVAIGTAMIMKARPLGDGAEKTKLLDEAVSRFDLALRLEPEAGNARRNRELALKMKGQTVPAVDPALQLDALLDTGAEMSRQGQSDEAVKYFRAAVDFAPRSVEARIYLALGLAKANRNAEALKQLQEASRLDAPGANVIITKALRLPEKSTNLEDIMSRLRASS